MNDRRPTSPTPRRLSWLLIAVATVGCGPDIRTIAAEDLAAHLAEGKVGQVFHLIDLRSSEVFARGHLPGARNLPYAQLADDPDLFDDGRPVIFYAETEPDVGRIEQALKHRLPPNIVALAGGYRGWLEAGLPLEKRPE
jgi:rhodanese-related sulfurtransferase